MTLAGLPKRAGRALLAFKLPLLDHLPRADVDQHGDGGSRQERTEASESQHQRDFGLVRVLGQLSGADGDVTVLERGAGGVQLDAGRIEPFHQAVILVHRKAEPGLRKFRRRRFARRVQKPSCFGESLGCRPHLAVAARLVASELGVLRRQLGLFTAQLRQLRGFLTDRGHALTQPNYSGVRLGVDLLLLTEFGLQLGNAAGAILLQLPNGAPFPVKHRF